MRTLILAVLFGLFCSSVAVAAPSNPSTPCSYHQTQGGKFVFTKACGAKERKLIPAAVRMMNERFTLVQDLRTAKANAQDFYRTNCARIVKRAKGRTNKYPKAFRKELRKVRNTRVATAQSWSVCYRLLPSSKLMQNMMLPGVSVKTFTWDMCSKYRKDLSKLARCARLASTDEDNKINAVINSILVKHAELVESKKSAKKFLQKVRGCKFKLGRLQCANGTSLCLAMLVLLLVRIVRRRIQRAARIKELKAMQGEGQGQGSVGVATKLSQSIATLLLMMAVALPTTPANAEKFECTSLISLVEMAAEDAIGAKIRFQALTSVASPFTDILANEKAHFKVKETAVEAMQKLFCKDIGNDEDEILTLMKLAKAFFRSEDMDKAIERELKALEIQEGSCGGFLLILLYGLLGMLGGCRSKLLVVLVALGCIVSTADAACTDMQEAVNEVTTQYGFLRYDCDAGEASQEDKDAVFEVIWRGFVAKDGLKLGMSKQYIRSRWERAEGAFWAVWGDAPLWQAQVAAAICAKETLCGVVVKFSEWETHRFQSPKNNNGTIDCGVTQINSNSTSYSCDELQDLQTAFREQRRIIMLKVGGSNRKSVWKARIHRYNGSGMKARQYGQLIMSWAK